MKYLFNLLYKISLKVLHDMKFCGSPTDRLYTYYAYLLVQVLQDQNNPTIHLSMIKVAFI